ncbi:MAG: FKBP-type peptidyl-prolyl cis-trans isomerase [Bacteroidales bacterium]|nr:FKBP-type peptidyl-prolyl cis-trans isomerase [Bacteroidales bacterium]
MKRIKPNLVIKVATIMVLFTACSLPQRITQPVYTTEPSGIQYRVTHRGDGNKPLINDMVYVHYRLLLEDSTLIDNSYDREEPVSFKMGAGQVIQGWERGISLLNEGDKAIMIIPPDLAYGERAVGDIPANSTLIFDVEVVKIDPAPKPLTVPANADITTTTSGLRYAVIKEGDGMMLVTGMRVRIHYNGFFEEDMTIFDSSFQRGEPIDFTLGKGMVIRGWEEGISKLRVGDIARLWIPYELAYGEQGRGPIPPATNLIFDVEVIDAEEVKRPEPFNVAGKDTLETETGLRYIIVNEGRGDFPEDGQIVRVHYTGFLMNGNIFDSSIERGQPFRFLLGRRQVISGWDEGVALMKPGARFRFIIPPDLAYGERAMGPIPSNATLIFDVELLSVE